MPPYSLHASARRRRRLVLGMILSASLHGLVLLLIPPFGERPVLRVSAPTPLIARLRPPPATEPPRQAIPGMPATAPPSAPRRPATAHSAATPTLVSPVQTMAVPLPRPAAPVLDFEAIRAAARRQAVEDPVRSVAPVPVKTVETAIAQAMAPDRLVESHGPAGQHVTQTRNMRCVTPLAVPHYMTGMTVPSQCQSRKS